MKICLVIGSRANWGRSRSFALAAKAEQGVHLRLVLIGSALQDEFGSTVNDVHSDGFHKFYEVPTETVYDEHYVQAIATSQALEELAKIFKSERPDYVVTIADRFETMSTAIAASYSNIKLVHIQGGEVSGNIDDKVRNAITMLSDIHFPCSVAAYHRVCRLLDTTASVYNFGCPAMDTVFNLNSEIQNEDMQKKLNRPYCMVSIHPNTENLLESYYSYNELLNLIEIHKEIVFLIIRPNIDAGNFMLREIINSMDYLENTVISSGLSPLDYALAMKKASLLVGNSSSFLRESTALGKPALILGSRQRGRDTFDNIYTITDSEIKSEFKKNFGKSFEPNHIYGRGDSGEKILQKLKELYNS